MLSKNQKRIRVDHYLAELMRITHNCHCSLFVNMFFVALSFVQLSSFLFKLNFSKFENQKAIVFLNVTFYSNFSNFLIYFSSPALTYLSFGLALIIVNFLLFYPLFLVILKRKFLYDIGNQPVFYYLDYFYQKTLHMFVWVLLVPFLEIAMNVTNCNIFSYLSNCGANSNFLWFPSVLLSVFSFIIGSLSQWLYKNNDFLSKDNLKREFNIFTFLIFSLRFLISIAFPLVFTTSSIVIYLILWLFVVFSFFDYIFEFPFRNPKINRLYIALICQFMAYLFVFMLFDYTSLIHESHFLYVQAIFGALAFKLGQNLKDVYYFKFVMINSSNIQSKCFVLEELIFLFQNILTPPNKLTLKGIFKNHVRHCLKPDCRFREKHASRFEELNDIGKMKILSDYICYVFHNSIEELNKSSSVHTNLRVPLERNIIKYASFLVKFNSNKIKAYFEVQKLMYKYQNVSFYFRCLKGVILEDIKLKIYEKEKENLLAFASIAGLIEEKELHLKDFLEIIKEKRKLDSHAQVILNEKLVFWTKYKEGLQSYSDFIYLIQRLSHKIIDFRDFLEKKQQKHSKSRSLFIFKYRSFFQSVALNNINEALKCEEEVDAIRRREYCQNKGVLSFSTLFDSSYLDLQISFLTNRGQILHSSRNSKLCNFFSYSMEEIKELKLYDLMPWIFAETHDLFFSWFLNRTAQKGDVAKRYTEVYAKKKEGLIFPIRIFIGQAFKINNDFVMHGVIKPLENKEKSMLFDINGMLHGVNLELFGVFQGFFKEIKPEQLNLLNAYSLIPDLLEILDRNNIFEQNKPVFIRNQSSTLWIPKNLTDIIEILETKRKAFEKATNLEKSIFSGASKTKKTGKSGNSITSLKQRQTHFLNTIYSTTKGDFSREKLGVYDDKTNNNMANKEIIDDLIDKEALNHLQINFDLKVHYYFYGQKPHQNLCLLYLIIQKWRLIQPTSNPHKKNHVLKNSSNLDLDNLEPSLLEGKMVANPDKFEEFTIENSKVSDVPTSFVQMPPENVPDFGQMSNNSDRNLSELNLNFPLMLEEAKKSSSSRQNADGKPKPSLMTVVHNTIQSSRKSYDPLDSPQRNLEAIKNLTTNQNLLSLTAPRNNFFNQEAPKGKGFLIVKNLPTFENPENIKKKPQKSLISSENNDDEMKDLEDLKGVSSGKAANIENDNQSKSISSISGINKTYAIFKSILDVQRHRPREVLFFSLISLFEACMVVIYCIVTFQFTVQYVSHYYNPLQKGLDNISAITIALNAATLSTVEMELYQRNLTSIESNSIGESLLFETIENSFNAIRTSMNDESSKNSDFPYQFIYKYTTFNVTDLTFSETVCERFVDFLENALQNLAEINQTNLNNQNLQILTYLIVNFEGFSNICNQILFEIQSEFITSNKSTTQSILVAMIFFLILGAGLKVFQIKSLVGFYKILVKIVSILLRVNEKAVNNELSYLREVKKEYFEDMEMYSILYSNFPEKLLQQKSTDVASEKDIFNSSSLKKKKHDTSQKKKVKKSSSGNLKSLSLLKQKLLVFLAFLVLFCYIFFIYFYWTITNGNISQLITKNNFFNLVFTTPNLIQTLFLLIFREKLFFSSSPNNKINTYFQKYQEQISIIDEITNNLPQNLFSTQTAINDAEFDIILQGNICDLFYEDGVYTPQEQQECKEILDGAFTHGFIQTFNQLINNIKNYQYMIDVNSSLYDANVQNNQILQFFAENKSLDLVIIQHLFEELNQIFFEISSKYYSTFVESEVLNMELCIILTTVIIALINFVIAVLSYRMLRKNYEELSIGLSLIPYERLIADEQIAFLIKKLIR